MKKYPKKRNHVAHANAKLGTVAGCIEKEYNLPVGSVIIINPNERKARKDKKVGNHRKDWQQH